MVSIGERVPGFEARTSRGLIKFPDDLHGKWIILFSYIGAFSPTDATDLWELDKRRAKLATYGTEVLGISADSVPAILAWLMSMRTHSKTGEPVGIELISDRDREISRAYGFRTESQDMSENEKAVYIIDADGVLRAKQVFPFNTGINVTELERLLLALKTAEHQFGQTPAGWIPGEEIMDHPPQTIGTAQTNMTDKAQLGGRCVDWYICYRQDTGRRTE